MLNYLEANEADPTMKSYDLGVDNHATSLYYSPTLDLIFVGTKSRLVKIISYSSQGFKEVQQLSEIHNGLISSIVYFPESQMLFCGSYDSTISTWLFKPATKSFEFQEKLEDLSDSVLSLSYIKILGKSEILVSLTEIGKF